MRKVKKEENAMAQRKLEELSDEMLVDELIRTVAEVAPASGGFVIDPMADYLREKVRALKAEVLRRLSQRTVAKEVPAA